MELDGALEFCQAEGWEVEVIYTSPPRGESCGVYRVIRCQKKHDGVLLLTAAREMEGGITTRHDI